MGPRSIDCFCPTYCRRHMYYKTMSSCADTQCLLHISELSFQKTASNSFFQIVIIYLYTCRYSILSLCVTDMTHASLHLDQILQSEINTVYNSMVMSLQDICRSMYRLKQAVRRLSSFFINKKITQNTKHMKNNISRTICSFSLDKTNFLWLITQVSTL